jgi:hypothetical protein
MSGSQDKQARWDERIEVGTVVDLITMPVCNLELRTSEKPVNKWRK